MVAVLVVGESLVDVVVAADGTRTEHVGGSALNVAVALARLGRDVRLASSWADDARGARIAARLEAEGVALAGDPLALARTATAVAHVAADGSASYDFDLEWRLKPLTDQVEAAVVYVCSIGAVLEPGADDVAALVARLRGRSQVVYDVNARPAITGTGPDLVSRVESLVRLVDVVKASDEDLEAIYPGRPLLAAMEHLLALGPRVVVATRGAAGATWLEVGGRWDVQSVPVVVADTIGAGDTLGAAVVDGLLRGDEVPAVLARAAAAAAVTVSRPGADPPYASELG